MNVLSLLIRWTAFARSKERYTTFKEPKYIHDERHYHVLHQNLPPRTCPPMAEEDLIGYASSGYHYAPFFAGATQTVQDRIYCLDCGVQTCNPLTRDQLMALHHPGCWMVKPGIVDMAMAQLEPAHYCIVRQ